MKTRLTIFGLTLVLLPLLALWLTDQSWPVAEVIEGDAWLPAAFSALVLLGWMWVLDTLSFRRSGQSLLRQQRPYVFALTLSGAGLGALFGYLNALSPLLMTSLSPLANILLASIFGALLLPAVLLMRLWLASFDSVLRALTRLFSLPSLPADSAALGLIVLAFSGLLGGMVWPVLVGLFWLSPLFLLSALQLLWQESTLFSGLKHGDISRLVLGAVSGIVLGGSVLACFELAGGVYNLMILNELFLFLLGVFGVLCLQMGDVVAELWRGKKRSELRRQKPFPIPVVVKK
jgi:hypothetical protein